jgi:hypothetical protein
MLVWRCRVKAVYSISVREIIHAVFEKVYPNSSITNAVVAECATAHVVKRVGEILRVLGDDCKIDSYRRALGAITNPRGALPEKSLRALDETAFYYASVPPLLVIEHMGDLADYSSVMPGLDDFLKDIVKTVNTNQSSVVVLSAGAVPQHWEMPSHKVHVKPLSIEASLKLLKSSIRDDRQKELAKKLSISRSWSVIEETIRSIDGFETFLSSHAAVQAVAACLRDHEITPEEQPIPAAWARAKELIETNARKLNPAMKLYFANKEVKN